MLMAEEIWPTIENFGQIRRPRTPTRTRARTMKRTDMHIEDVWMLLPNKKQKKTAAMGG
jgi:hypothetical protein